MGWNFAFHTPYFHLPGDLNNDDHDHVDGDDDDGQYDIHKMM